MGQVKKRAAYVTHATAKAQNVQLHKKTLARIEEANRAVNARLCPNDNSPLFDENYRYVCLQCRFSFRILPPAVIDARPAFHRSSADLRVLGPGRSREDY